MKSFFLKKTPFFIFPALLLALFPGGAFASAITTDTDVSYTSTFDALTLTMDVSYDTQTRNAPILLVLHGHGGPFNGTDIIERHARKGLFAIKTYRRGEGTSEGTADDSGREIHDFIDAVEYVKKEYAGRVDPTNINVVGYSGGGGNVYGLVTKFPDYFRSANVFFGMSDYGHDDTFGWYKTISGNTRSTVRSRIGGTPSEVPDRYYARAHHLGAKNNPYTHIQLFYDADETEVPVTHASRYANSPGAEAFTNIITRISDANTTESEVSDTFSDGDLDGWSFLGNGSAHYTWNSAGHLDWTTNGDTSFDVMSKRFGSLRNYDKDDYIRAGFKLTITTAEPGAAVAFGFRNSTDETLNNSVALTINNQRPRLRIDYNGVPLLEANRERTAFDTKLEINTAYYFELEIHNKVATAILKDAHQNVLESKVRRFTGSLGFHGVDSFGLYDFPAGEMGTMAGTLDDVQVTSFPRWVHGYPQEGGGIAEGNIVAEKYFIPDIVAGTWDQPSLHSSGSMFVPGFVKTKEFFLLLGEGADEAGELAYDISGAGNAATSAKTFTVEGLTGPADFSLDVYHLHADTDYVVTDNDLLAGVASSTLVTTNASGTLHYAGVFEGIHRFDVYRQSFFAGLPKAVTAITLGGVVALLITAVFVVSRRKSKKRTRLFF